MELGVELCTEYFWIAEQKAIIIFLGLLAASSISYSISYLNLKAFPMDPKIYSCTSKLLGHFYPYTLTIFSSHTHWQAWEQPTSPVFSVQK